MNSNPRGFPAHYTEAGAGARRGNSYNVLMTKRILGLDIGGANLKAAHTNGVARTLVFPLWRQPECLAAKLTELCASMPEFDRIAVTMTGELCDCFETKREGVAAILRSACVAASKSPVRVWCLKSRFLDVNEAIADPLSVAAANWLAEAHLVARRWPDEKVLLIDAGSTTTDIVYLNCGRPEPRGLTDSERLASGELVYTGVRRTPICAVLNMEVAAEFFATMHDAYVVAGLSPEAPDDCDTADGRPANRRGAHARLARMRCADTESFSLDDARRLAEHALQTQWNAVVGAVERVLHGKPAVERVVISGSGEVLGRSVAARTPTLNRVRVTSLADTLGPALSEAACAYAVAMLAAEETDDER